MSIRLIASDLDETLLDNNSRLTERTVAALKRAMAAGAYVVLASGRMVKAMSAYAETIKPNAPIIAFNGALTYDCAARRALDARRIPAQDARAIALACRETGLHVQAFTDDEYWYERKNDLSESYAQGIGGIYGRATGAPLEDWIDRPLCKMLMIVDPAAAPEITARFNRQFGERAVFAISRASYIECTARGVGKGAALAALAAHLGVAQAEVAAFGDAQNDLDMLKWAGHGYAVANARPEVLESALPAPATDDDGVARVIEQMLDQGRVAPPERID